MSQKKVYLRQLVCIAAFFIFVGSNFSMNPSVEAKEKELLMVSGFAPKNLDPAAIDTGAGVLHKIGAIEFLVAISNQGSVEPELAKSFRSLDPYTWEVTLHPNATFWSGKPVNAKAVKASLERSRKLAPQARQTLNGVRIEVVDPLTLHLITETPTPFLFKNISTTAHLAIHNADSYADEPNALNITAMDTTGMFRVIDFKPNQFISLERWDGYRRRKSQIDRIRYKRVTDPQSLLLEALSGKSHVVRSIPPEGARLIEKSGEMDLIEIKGPGVIT